MKFKDMYELGVRASRYESLLREEVDKKNPNLQNLLSRNNRYGCCRVHKR
jgi:hypothetical protein